MGCLTKPNLTFSQLFSNLSDTNLDRFIKYLLIVLITIFNLTTTNNLFKLFIG